MTDDNQQAAAGRPRLSDIYQTVIVSVTMPKSYRDFLERMDRNTSAAVRLLIEAAMEEEDK